MTTSFIRAISQSLEICSFALMPKHFPVHFHEYFLVGRLKDCSRSLLLKGLKTSLVPDALLLLNAGDAHACEGLGASGSWKCLHIFPQLLYGFFPAAGPRFFQNNIVVDNGLIGQFEYIFEGLAKNGRKMLFKLADFLGNLHNAACSMPAAELENARLDKICEQFAGENLNLSEMAALAHMSKYHFCRTFSKNRGIAPGHYMLNLRLIRAKKLLGQGTSPLQTAQETGFCDQAHLGKTFRLNLGYTPAEYRLARTACLKTEF